MRIRKTPQDQVLSADGDKVEEELERCIIQFGLYGFRIDVGLDILLDDDGLGQLVLEPQTTYQFLAFLRECQRERERYSPVFGYQST
jgi:hypothetical protein